MQLFHIGVFLHGLKLFAQKTDCIFKFLAIAVPVLEVLDVFEGREIQGGDAKLDHVLFGAGVRETFVVQTEIHFEIPLVQRQLVGRNGLTQTFEFGLVFRS